MGQLRTHAAASGGSAWSAEGADAINSSPAGKGTAAPLALSHT
jgi:hypothetical protein